MGQGLGGARNPRREMLSAAVGVAAAGVLGPWARAAEAFAADSPAGCIVRPEQVAGPFYRDKRDNRSDIRADAASGKILPGIPLDLTFSVSRLDGQGCRRLSGAVVDVWNSGVDGQYSETALRGFQTTDKDGLATFRTVFPGWYSGRTVHIHFKVRTPLQGSSGHEFISELYFADALLDEVHGRVPYSSRGRRTTANTSDGMFRAKGAELMLPVTPHDEGYKGTFDIALKV